MLKYRKQLLILIVALPLLASCDFMASPLTGIWADGAGNRLTLAGNFEFALNVVSGDTPIQYGGTYAVFNNNLSFSVNDGRTIVTEWDVRGQIMYLNWPAAGGNGQMMNLVLYKTGK